MVAKSLAGLASTLDSKHNIKNTFCAPIGSRLVVLYRTQRELQHPKFLEDIIEILKGVDDKIGITLKQISSLPDDPLVSRYVTLFHLFSALLINYKQSSGWPR